MIVSPILLALLATISLAGDLFTAASEKVWMGLEKDPAVWEGKEVELDGWIIPNEFEKGKITTFLLARYPGGCVHVPLPPPSSVIEVQSKTGIAATKITQRYHVKGKIKKGARVDASTQLTDAEVTLTPP